MRDTEDKIPVIASMTAINATCREIAEAIGMSYSQVSRIQRRAEVKQIIANCESAIAAKSYAKATANIIRTVELYDPDIPVDPEDKHKLAIQEAGLRCSLKIAEGIGLTPSNSMAPMVQQINVAGNAQIVSPLVDRALAQAMLVPDTTICSAEDD